MHIANLLHLHQWPKNLLIVLPAFFAGVEWNVVLVGNLLLGVLCFCLLASAVYVVNDRLDLASDRLHPEKQKRVAVAERYATTHLLGLAVGFALIALGGMTLLGTPVLGFGLVYLFINTLYNALLKHLAVVDIITLTFGYWLRLLVGGAIAGVPLTGWLLALVALIALLLLLIKRRSDVLLYRQTGVELRASVRRYAGLPIETLLHILTVLILIGYTGYLIQLFYREHRSPVGLLTLLPAVSGLYRFLYLTKREPHKDVMQQLLTDGGMWALGITWLGILLLTIYRVV